MKRRLLIILSVGAIALIWAFFDGPAARQQRGMNDASEFARQLAPKLAADSRFARVETGVSTHPALRVYGEVSDEQSLRDLNALLTAPADTSFRIFINVKILNEPSSRP